jgi:hypothetical protein
VAHCDPCNYRRSSGPPDARARADQRVFAAGCLTEQGAAADPDATPLARNVSVAVEVIVKPPTRHVVAIVSDRCSGQTAPGIN